MLQLITGITRVKSWFFSY